MTQDEIIHMAQKAGILEPIDLLPSNQWRQDTIRELERFANLVVEATKEKAAKVAGSYDASVWSHCPTSSHAADMVSASIAAAIRRMK